MNAIPDREEPKRYFNHAFRDSKMVAVESGKNLLVEMQYPLLGLKCAEERCFVREEVYPMLLDAARKLPKGYRLKILDAWRPFALQKELYDKYSEEIIDNFSLREMCAEEQKRIISRFVSVPEDDRANPPVHTTGGSVDVTVINANGKEIDMGTGFDEFSQRTKTDYFEKEITSEIKENRRMLYHAMTGAGFTNLPSEWWHYDYGNRFWGFYWQEPVLYRGLFCREEF